METSMCNSLDVEDSVVPNGEEDVKHSLWRMSPALCQSYESHIQPWSWQFYFCLQTRRIFVLQGSRRRCFQWDTCSLVMERQWNITVDLLFPTIHVQGIISVGCTNACSCILPLMLKIYSTMIARTGKDLLFFIKLTHSCYCCGYFVMKEGKKL